MLRFVSENGTGALTKILNSETGEDVSKLVAVEYGATITLGHIITAECRIDMVEANIVAGITTFLSRNPLTGSYEPVAAIEFRDGTKVVFAEDGTPSLEAAPK